MEDTVLTCSIVSLYDREGKQDSLWVSQSEYLKILILLILSPSRKVESKGFHEWEVICYWRSCWDDLGRQCEGKAVIIIVLESKWVYCFKDKKGGDKMNHRAVNSMIGEVQATADSWEMLLHPRSFTSQQHRCHPWRNWQFLEPVFKY